MGESGRDCDGRRKSRKEKSSSRIVTEGEIIRYMVKKAQNKASRVAKKLKTGSVLDYSNDSNPFGDSNLNEKFVWRKKIERDVVGGVPLDEFSVKAERKRQRERMAEIEKVKKRRTDRETEKARHEEEIALLDRDRARAEFEDWERKEAEFEFEQSKVRSQIRLREGRSKPIDVLIKYLAGFDEEDIELSEPCMVFKGLTVKEMEEICCDIKMYKEFDRVNPMHVQYWDAVMVICDWEIAEGRKREAKEPPAELFAQERGLRGCLEEDIRRTLNGKTYKELEEIQLGIESHLRSGSAMVVEYWESLVKRLHLYKAKAFLEELHAEMLRRRRAVMEEQKNHIQEVIMASKPVTAEDQAMVAMEEGDAIFNSEVNLDSQVYWWHEQYRPRKPKYFNCLHMGYDWNLYNRTHYDHDHPPPKMVRGYKFNIFYPDLIDKTKTPTYTVEKDGDNFETCIIRFQAGPPYEDIAFRIVNKDWEYSPKKMFKCTFERGILHLRFNFKRYGYRR